MEKKLNSTNSFESFAMKVSKAAGSTAAFSVAFIVIIGWAILGPFFNFSAGWQLFINTTTTIVTFLMVFLIQKAQNKDSLAIQLKLNELVASHEYASNRLVDIEELTEEEMKIIQKYYARLSRLSQKEESLLRSHSIDEAQDLQLFKEEMREERDEKIEKSKRQKSPQQKTTSSKVNTNRT
ncbi:low affinity iron permease family protein [Flavobacterium sp. MAH-1]|uniref:Low affinity iron permease family protein n=1 Tax=Flavobacterium agri TaxID=2743471 RepID=A0A7Y8Y411_9FLAO|nr:low affinity iron permease family protein [Flavobacterium agri]NUY82180.1 low affinity iron permease family protein [Flavobacterium agri]NYA72204.1 low affinity iron permease family protein [Flavobacterium agri]